jgi:hypothetical protein
MLQRESGTRLTARENALLVHLSVKVPDWSLGIFSISKLTPSTSMIKFKAST